MTGDGMTARSAAHFRRHMAMGVDQWLAELDERHARHEATPHYVYRAFDSYGLLLYIGCSLNVEKRMATHASQSSWERYCETLSISTPYASKSEARAAEKQAIDTEASYFNCTQADTNRTQANRNAATRILHTRGDFLFDHDAARLDDPVYCERLDSLAGSWYARRDALMATLKAGAYPYLTEQDRVARYLAAREDAELARLERAA